MEKGANRSERCGEERQRSSRRSSRTKEVTPIMPSWDGASVGTFTTYPFCVDSFNCLFLANSSRWCRQLVAKFATHIRVSHVVR